jgi:hypothetical protein
VQFYQTPPLVNLEYNRLILGNTICDREVHQKSKSRAELL